MMAKRRKSPIHIHSLPKSVLKIVSSSSYPSLNLPQGCNFSFRIFEPCNDERFVYRSSSDVHRSFISPSPRTPSSPPPLKGGGKGWGLNSLNFHETKESIGLHQKDKDEDDIRNNFPQ